MNFSPLMKVSKKGIDIMIPYKDSYALITGASKGLGSAYAKALAQRGANLVLVARSLEPMERLAVELRSKHRVRIGTIQADLTNVSSVGQIAKRLTQLQIRIDLLVNNAGAGLSGRFLGHTTENEISQINLNVQGLAPSRTTLAMKWLPEAWVGSSTSPPIRPFSRSPIWQRMGPPRPSSLCLLRR